MTTYDEIMDELRNALLVEDLDSISDRGGEWIDGWVPIYNGEIIAEWQEMPSDYDNRGALEFGYNPEELSIISLMQSDLYLYYGDLLARALDELESEISR